VLLGQIELYFAMIPLLLLEVGLRFGLLSLSNQLLPVSFFILILHNKWIDFFVFFVERRLLVSQTVFLHFFAVGDAVFQALFVC